MKFFACLALLALTSLTARADNWLKNGDFANGNDHWYGDAKWPTDFAPPDPFTKADPFTSQGMIVPLKGAGWTKECQDFKGNGVNAVIRITYVISPGFAFSTKTNDYQNMPDKIHWDAWRAFDSPPGSWVVFISELSARHGTYYLIQPDLTSTKEQTFTAPITSEQPLSEKTVALAFPPGEGTLVVRKIEIDPQ